MKKIILIPLVAFIMLVLPSYSQEKQLIRKAALATDKMEYEKAIAYYDEVLAQNSNSYLANVGKGMVLSEFLERYDQAIPYLEKALSVSPKDTLFRINNSLGKSFQFTGNYSRAIYYYNKVYAQGKKNNPDFDVYLDKHIANCKYALEHNTVAPVSEQWIKNIGLPINSNMPEYGAVAMGNNLIFTSERQDNSKEKRNGVSHKYFETIYQSTLVDGKYSEPVRYSFPDNQDESKYIKHNEAIISVSSDGKKLYIFRDGRIFETDMQDSSKEVNKLDKNVNIAKYQNHASLSPDGNELYFVSLDKKGVGGTDIYTTKKGLDGNWSAPIILETTVNTYFDEDAPFMSSDGTLYFSSNGLPGYGGFDVYKTHKVDGVWTTPENLGQPINSAGDDLYFTLGNNSTEGFYSSARVGGQGDMDIYKVHYYVPALEVKPIAEPLMTIVAPQIITDTIIKNPIVVVESVKKADWDPSVVYFDFDKYTLQAGGLATLDYDVTELKKNADYTFTINGYADSRGTDEYNKALSARRAGFIKNYLIQKGISQHRINATNSFGETMPVNNCTNGVVCTDDQQQMNRRVELKIIDRENKVKPFLGVTKK